MVTTLRGRLLLTVGLLALAAVTAVALAVRQGARTEFLHFRDVERRAASMSGADRGREIARRIDGRCCAAGSLDAAVAEAGLGSSLVTLVVEEASGRLVASAGEPMRHVSEVSIERTADTLGLEATQHSGPLVNRIALKWLQPGILIRLVDGSGARLYVVPFPTAEGDARANAFLGSLDRRLVVATAGVALLALAFTWALARRTVQPIMELRAAARDLGHGDLTRRVAARGADEVADLARAFNAMAAELERQQALRRGLVHDVAHELRTPLTALRCRIETVVDGLATDPARALADVRDEVLHLGRLVDDLQELALAEARELRLGVTDVALETSVDSALRAAGLGDDGRVRRELAPAVMVRADPVRLRQMLLNLLTNADRHTPADGTLTVRGRREDGRVCVEVENTGSTVDAEQCARLFDRFYRTDPSRQRGTGGVGLGLAIVRHLVEAQGGRVHASSTPDSVTVGFTLPSVP
jgi:signal transduction histidine kinase